MRLENVKVGLGITGSFCNFDKVADVIKSLQDEGAEVVPILSYVSQEFDTRFNNAKEFRIMLEENTGNEVIDTIVKAEPLGPKNRLDVILICPCTGNTTAKLANAITDTPVLMATKGHMRNNKPVVLAIATNDGLGLNLKNIGTLMCTKNVFFVPFSQDDYINKPKSLVLDYKYVVDTVVLAMEGKQIQPVISRT